MSKAVSIGPGPRVIDIAADREPVHDQFEQTLKAHARTFLPQQLIVMEGDENARVLCVLDGWLSMSKSLPNGECQIVDFALRGEIIEAGGSASPVNIAAVTQASVAIIPAATWDALGRQRPDLGRICSDIRAASRARISGRMLRIGRGRAAMRLAYALLELSVRLEAIGQASRGKFHVPVNQRLLGDFVGLSSVHVCRTLGLLTRDGALHVWGQMHIEILDHAALADIAGVDLDALRREINIENGEIGLGLGDAAFA